MEPKKQENQMSNALKPCPFCGGEATVEYLVLDEFDIEDSQVISFKIGCYKCEVWQCGTQFETEAQATAAWNTRANGWKPASEPPKDAREVALEIVGFYEPLRKHWWSDGYAGTVEPIRWRELPPMPGGKGEKQ